jgi:hypothetical protein
MEAEKGRSVLFGRHKYILPPKQSTKIHYGVRKGALVLTAK